MVARHSALRLAARCLATLGIAPMLGAIGACGVTPDLTSGAETLRPDPERVIELLRQGASMVCNDIDSLNPDLIATATAVTGLDYVSALFERAVHDPLFGPICRCLSTPAARPLLPTTSSASPTVLV